MDKPWRLHLANSAIQHLDIIPGDPPLLVVWARGGKVSYYDLERGSAHGASEFKLHDSPEKWLSLLDSLKDPKDRTLPFARVDGLSVWPIGEDKAITYHGRARISLLSGEAVPPQELILDTTPVALAIDPATQLVAALDGKGALLLGKIGGTVKTLKPGLTVSDDLPLSVVVARGGKRIVVSDGARLIVIDSGKVSGRRDLHYACGLVALSPSGEILMTFDGDSGVLRVYTPDGLKLTHQRFVSDLLSAADELQLTGFAELPPTSAALSALAVDDDGRFAFAVFGQICGASIASMSSTDGAPIGGMAATPSKSALAKPQVEHKQQQKIELVAEGADELAVSPKVVDKPVVKSTASTGGIQRATSTTRPVPKPTPKMSQANPADEETLPIDPPHSDDL